VSITRQHEYVKQEQAALKQDGGIGEPSKAVGFVQSKQKKMAKPFKPQNTASIEDVEVFLLSLPRCFLFLTLDQGLRADVENE